MMVASEDCAEKGGASYGHYAQALEKITQLKSDMRRYIYKVTTIKLNENIPGCQMNSRTSMT